MAVFIDGHARTEIRGEAILRGLDAAESGTYLVAGARPLDFLLGGGGRVFCIMEADDEQSVRELHAAIGFPAPTGLVTVEGAEGLSPLSDADRELVLRLIQVRPH